tara:strand:+ start:81703 stop:82779 length:1077 start_codon:yes stop_codon:yes gene_type:complete
LKIRAIALALALAAPGAAQAGLEFCNQTGANASVAIGYKGSGGWVSEGWWNVDAGACKTVISRDLDLSHYYWRAESTDLSWSHANYMFCTTDEAFTIVGDEDCAARGYDREGFNELEMTGYTSFTMNLTNEGDGRTGNLNGGGRDPEENIVYPDENPAQYDSAASDVVIDPVGTHGEPYSITGILSHCDVLDNGIQCTILADGWIYVADSYSPTPLPMLEDLLNAGENRAIQISGDLMDYAGQQANVTIREYSFGNPDAYSVERGLMQGWWTSVDDASYELVIYGSMFEEYYSGNPDLAAFMFYQWGCDSAFDGQIAFQLVSWDGNEQRCASIEYVDDASMSIWVAGTMKPLRFRRAN